MITVQLETDDQSWQAAMAAVATGCRDSVQAGLDAAVRTARASHPYQDRTGGLTSSIEGTIDSVDSLGAEGSFSANAGYASFVDGGTKPHRIEARDGGVLRWYGIDAGDVHFARGVNHPGTRPMPFMEPAAAVAEDVITSGIEASVARAAELMT